MRPRSDVKACTRCGAVGRFAWFREHGGRWRLVAAQLDPKGAVVRDSKGRPVPADPLVPHICREPLTRAEVAAWPEDARFVPVDP